MSKVHRKVVRRMILATVAAASVVACGGASEQTSSDDQPLLLPVNCISTPQDPKNCPPPPPPPKSPPAPKVYCAYETSCPPGEYSSSVAGACSLTTPGTFPAGGCNAFPAFTAPVITSVAIGASTVYGIGAPAVPVGTSDNRTAVFAWGNNTNYQLGNGTTASSLTPVVALFDANHPVTKIAAGREAACALLSNGTVQCWGTVLTTPRLVEWPNAQQVAFPTGTTIAGITHGANHACAWTTDSNPTVYCWGDNLDGQLGVDPATTNGAGTAYAGAPIAVPFAQYNATASSPVGQIISVVASGNTTCALAYEQGTSQENVYCWGDDEMGSLGYDVGTPGNASFKPVQVNSQEGPSGGFGVPAPAAYTQLVGGSGSFGSFCAVAQTNGDASPGSWFCWGADDQGQLDQPAPVPSPSGIEGLAEPTPLADTSISQASLFALGSSHGCAEVSSSGSSSLYCFGDNDDGQLGVASGSAGTSGTPAQAAAPPTGIPGYTAIAAGDNFTCGIYVSPSSATPSYGTANASGNIACWGGDSGGLVSSYAPTFLTW